MRQTWTENVFLWFVYVTSKHIVRTCFKTVSRRSWMYCNWFIHQFVPWVWQVVSLVYLLFHTPSAVTGASHMISWRGRLQASTLWDAKADTLRVTHFGDTESVAFVEIVDRWVLQAGCKVFQGNVSSLSSTCLSIFALKCHVISLVFKYCFRSVYLMKVLSYSCVISDSVVSSYFTRAESVRAARLRGQWVARCSLGPGSSIRDGTWSSF